MSLLTMSERADQIAFEGERPDFGRWPMRARIFGAVRPGAACPLTCMPSNYDFGAVARQKIGQPNSYCYVTPTQLDLRSARMVRGGRLYIPSSAEAAALRWDHGVWDSAPWPATDYRIRVGAMLERIAGESAQLQLLFGESVIGTYDPSGSSDPGLSYSIDLTRSLAAGGELELRSTADGRRRCSGNITIEPSPLPPQPYSPADGRWAVLGFEYGQWVLRRPLGPHVTRGGAHRARIAAGTYHVQLPPEYRTAPQTVSFIVDEGSVAVATFPAHAPEATVTLPAGELELSVEPGSHVYALRIAPA
jgi:hypothetical protein